MTPDEAVKAIEGLREVASIQLASFKPGDVLVLECQGQLDEWQYLSLSSTIEHVFPGHRVIVLEDGATLKVARAVQPEKVSA